MSVPDPSADELALLLDLQATDSRRRKLRRQLDVLPQQQELAAARELNQRLAEELDEVSVALERVGAEQRQFEREVDVLTQRRDAEQARLYDGTVTNQREMRSVKAEIDTTVRRIEEHEELLLDALERGEELESRRSQLEAGRASATARAAELAEERDAAAADLLRELDSLAATRDEQAEQLPRALLQRYEQVAARPGGAAVGKLAGNTCTACGITLSYADVGELLAGPPLTECPQCGRLLVIDP